LSDSLQPYLFQLEKPRPLGVVMFFRLCLYWVE